MSLAWQHLSRLWPKVLHLELEPKGVFMQTPNLRGYGNFLRSDAADYLQDHGRDEHETDAGEDTVGRLHPTGGSIKNRG